MRYITSKVINPDKMVYTDYYPNFLNKTDEKDITSLLNQELLKNLGEHRLLGGLKGPIKVADIGCGPGTTITQYLANVHPEAKWDVRATDSNPHYTAEYYYDDAGVAHIGQAKKELYRAKVNGLIARYHVNQGDAFAKAAKGTTSELLRDSDDLHPAGTFQLAFLSHMLYHRDIPGAEALVVDTAKNVLAKDGVAVLYHVKYDDKPDNFQNFRARFGRKSKAEKEHDGTAEQSDTGAMNVTDPPRSVAEICKRNNIPCREVEFRTLLHFDDLSNEQWDKLKDPVGNKGTIEGNEKLMDTFGKAMFVTQRAPRLFAADTSEFNLAHYIDELKAAVRLHHNTLPLIESLQVLTRPDAEKDVNDRVDAAVNETRSRVKEVQQKGAKAYDARALAV